MMSAPAASRGGVASPGMDATRDVFVLPRLHLAIATSAWLAVFALTWCSIEPSTDQTDTTAFPSHEAHMLPKLGCQRDAWHTAFRRARHVDGAPALSKGRRVWPRSLKVAG
jgi:hypothetical protein